MTERHFRRKMKMTIDNGSAPRKSERNRSVKEIRRETRRTTKNKSLWKQRARRKRYTPRAALQQPPELYRDHHRHVCFPTLGPIIKTLLRESTVWMMMMMTGGESRGGRLWAKYLFILLHTVCGKKSCNDEEGKAFAETRWWLKMMKLWNTKKMALQVENRHLRVL